MKARFTGSQKGRENESQETGGDEKKRKKRQVVMGADCAHCVLHDADALYSEIESCKT